jgi:Predicted ornithine cyclodeaminase, mu-crystallin homolog
MDIKAGHLVGAGLYGLKIIGWAADNPGKRNLPALAGLVVVMDIETQQPLGLVEARTVTRLRTGAAGAVGAKALSREDSKVVLVVGLGEQGESHVGGAHLRAPGPGAGDCLRSGPGKNESLCCENGEEVPISSASRDSGLDRLLVAAQEADMVVTCTPSHKAFLKKEWIRPGTHINAIGADLVGKQELDLALVASSRVVADSREQVLRQGECQAAYRAGRLSGDEVDEIGEILLGRKPGRRSDDEITIFDATGMAIQDILTAELALARAGRENLGSSVEI